MGRWRPSGRGDRTGVLVTAARIAGGVDPGDAPNANCRALYQDARIQTGTDGAAPARRRVATTRRPGTRLRSSDRIAADRRTTVVSLRVNKGCRPLFLFLLQLCRVNAAGTAVTMGGRLPFVDEVKDSKCKNTLCVRFLSSRHFSRGSGPRQRQLERVVRRNAGNNSVTVFRPDRKRQHRPCEP